MYARTVALTASVLFEALSLVAVERQEFSGNFRVQLVDDSIWAHCEVDISRWDSTAVEQLSECRVEDGKPQKARRLLAPAEILELTRLLRESALFEGRYWGQDRRGLDVSLQSITVDDGARVATVVGSFNPSFNDGPRKALLASLMARARESMKTSGPTKR